MTKETASDAARVDPAIVSVIRKRLADHDVIRAGKLPTLPELLAGAPFYRERLDLDIQIFCDDLLAVPGKLSALEKRMQVEKGSTASALKRLRDTCSADALKDAGEILERLDHHDWPRLDVYLACSGDSEARDRVADYIEDDSDWLGIRSPRIINGSLFRALVIRGLRSESPAGSMADYLTRGLREASALAEGYGEYTAAVDELQRQKLAENEAKIADIQADADFLERVLEDRGEIRPAPALVVVPALTDGGSSGRKDVVKAWKDTAGRPLPLVGRGDIAEQRRQLVERWPHAADVIDIILGDLAASETVRFRPTLLVGAPGSGKSSLARALCEIVGLPVELYSLAGVHDASLMGTSAQWATSRESVPLQLIKRSGRASVGVVWDEVEKPGTRTENGNALDALLPLLEIDQARRFRDLALEVECDLSAVSHFATANSLEGVPAPLRDRMRILTMPSPGWHHIGSLSRQIIERVSKERGIDPRFFEPLAQDEIDLVRQAWPGGSLRQLTRIVTTILDGREQLMGRC
ncbi:hypothetical protein GCM10007989_13440 [Devosia pacifica]|uniref:ATPase AAA-type core domain-containing protein n=1 Tax=Devosia pacifica TaxID=1335967 RepID=A0A918S1W2_9HYPH|nr:AAA family ATPase [Devosia pacifica]GHA19256.1 hypothetical protein GCM10007989_13440 [Devosia pacifica]